MKTFKLTLLAAALVMVSVAQATEAQNLGDVVVTSPMLAQPHQVNLDPKKPMQPIPAADGAGLLKTVSNMAVIRKGGMAGDPILRGLGGSRLLITANDAAIYGGCGGRMDPPTSYIFPASYDDVVITKGPQTVTQGPGVIAGAVVFKRTPVYFTQKGINGMLGVTGGSFGRFDAQGMVTAGLPLGYLRTQLLHNEAGDYKDGDGHAVHSKYRRDAQHVALGLTPDTTSVLELAYDRSRGFATYATKFMDGATFDRDTWQLSAEKRELTPLIRQLQFKISHSDIDHVMDNYSYRDVDGGKYMVGNPSRKLWNGRVALGLDFDTALVDVGVDFMHDEHLGRGSGPQTSAQAAEAAYQAQKPIWDQRFNQIGVFAEANYSLSEQGSLKGGLRADHVKARYNPKGKKFTVGTEAKKNYLMGSAFARYEHRVNQMTFFAGLGIAQRSPDFWERNKTAGDKLKAETNQEVTLGWLLNDSNQHYGVTLFGSNMPNYILVDGAKIRNIDAHRLGIEAEARWRIADVWKLGVSAAYTYGKNRSDKLPLAQIAPAEAKVTLGYEQEKWSVQLLGRLVAEQTRIAKGQGNIVGFDNKTTPGFATLAINASWQPKKYLTVSAGVDNLFDKTYREHLNLRATDVTGYNPSNGVQVNEPGRQLWAQLSAKF